MKHVQLQNTDLLKQSNKITTAKHELNPLEAKAVILAYSKFSPEDKTFQEYQFTIGDVAKAISRDDSYDYIWTVLRGIQKKAIQLQDGKKRMSYIPLPSIILDEESGTVGFKLNDDLKPYFLELRQEYTMFPTEYAFRLAGKYSLRIYQLCMQWQEAAKKNHGVFVVRLAVSDLREMFMIKPDEYKKAVDFKKRVIEGPITEINSADIGIILTLEPPTKQGKLITHYNLKMRLIDPTSMRVARPKTKAEESTDAFISKNKELYERCKKFIEESPDLFPAQPWENGEMSDFRKTNEIIKMMKSELDKERKNNGKKTK